MSKVLVNSLSVSLDGFVAGPCQCEEHPLGIGGERLHDWAFATRTFRHLLGMEGGATGPDDDLAARGVQGVGAHIIGRNMFGPIRGDWGDESWTGWWGEEPPYHHPVFVLTHHPRQSLVMQGGTTFHFVTDGLEAALQRAVSASGGQAVRIGGGASTVRQFVQAGLVDEMHLAVAPVLLGRGERLFGELSELEDAFTIDLVTSSPAAAHFVLQRR